MVSITTPNAPIDVGASDRWYQPYAGRNDPPPIGTDRPSITDSSVVVPPGSLQFENGVSYTVNLGEQTLDGPETLLRFGVASKTELRFTAPDYYGQIGSGSGIASGFGDVATGVKQQLGPAAGFDVSVILSLSMPTGAQGVSSHGYDPSVQLHGRGRCLRIGPPQACCRYTGRRSLADAM